MLCFCYTTFRSGQFGLSGFGLSRFGLSRFSLADSVTGFSVMAVSVSRHFGLGCFGFETFRSDYEILPEILQAHFLMQMYLNQQKKLFKKNYKQYPISNR